MIPAAFDYKADQLRKRLLLSLNTVMKQSYLREDISYPNDETAACVPSVLVDIAGVNDLSYIDDRDDHIAIGALAKHRSLETSDLLIAGAHCLRMLPAKSVTCRLGIVERLVARLLIRPCI